MSLAELLGVKEAPRVKIDDEDIKPKRRNPFEYVTAIQQTGVDLIGDDEQAEKEYDPFIVNRAMSMGLDTTVPANEMNGRPHIPKKAQFLFLLNFVRKQKRYNKWIKAEPEENVALIQKAFKCNVRKARVALRILTEDDIETIREKLNEGGVTNAKNSSRRRARSTEAEDETD